jgi:DNA-binding LacI/PurR family transcriptional regulator
VGKCIHYLTFVDDSPAIQLPLGDILSGLQESFPEVSLKTHLVPLRNALQYVRAEVEQAKREPSLAGIVLALGTREIQQYLADSGLPVVVSGSVYPGIHLPSIDVDQKQLGQLLAQQALRSGHQRLVFVGRELWRRGDNLAFEGVQEVAHAAGLGHNGIMVRNISSTTSAIAVEIEHLLDEIALPAALICRVPHCAGAAADAAQRRGLRIPDDLSIVCDNTFEEGTPLPFFSVRCGEGRKEQFVRIGRMLAQLGKGEMPDPLHVLVPVEESPASKVSY